MRTSVCETCKKEFILRPRVAKQKTCSKECRSEYEKNRRSPATERICPICGKSFMAHGTRINCSDECAEIGRKKWFEKNRERLQAGSNERTRRWLLNNGGRAAETPKQRASRNKRERERYYANHDERLNFARKWREENRIKVLTYRFKSKHCCEPPKELIEVQHVNILIKRLLQGMKND